MAFRLSDVPVIAQTKDMACWYASAQMLIQWRRERTRSSEIAHPDPSEVPSLVAEFVANNGLPPAQVVDLARKLGLTPVPPMTPGPAAIEHWLKTCGPLWFAGMWQRSAHAVVITGISDSGIEINNPEPVNQGSKATLSLSEYGDKVQPLDREMHAPNILYFAN